MRAFLRAYWKKIALIVLFLTTLTGMAGIWMIYRYYTEDLPTFRDLSDYRPNLISRVYARDYQLLGEFYTEKRRFLPRDAIPERLIQAFLAIEDTQFYNHVGIDFSGILRATLVNLAAGRIVQGASTITQQVAKTFLLSSKRTFDRKIKEIILAIQMEAHFTKDEILTLYLNQIYLGASAYGVSAAAHLYFDRDVSELTLGQMALLAALPKAPNRYNPWRHPEAARKRQSLVLRRMEKAGFETREAVEEALASPLDLAHPKRSLKHIAPHFLEHVRRELFNTWGSDNLYRIGLDIYTSLDPALQRSAQNAVRRGLIHYDRRHGYSGPLQQNLSRESWEKISLNQTRPIGMDHALVTDSDATHANILLQDGEEATLTLDSLSWARKRLRKRDLGPRLQRVDEALHQGDMILVSKTRSKSQSGSQPGFSYRLAQEPDADAALIALDPHTGQILAMVGGYDFQRSEFNRVTQAQRQPGSAFKPILYAAALEQGYTPATRVDDTPLPIASRDSDTGSLKFWRAENYERQFFGPTTLRTALEHSRNLVTIRLLKKIGIPYATTFADRFGLFIPKSRWNLSLSLGSVEFTPIQMTSAYGVFANGGFMIEPVAITRIQDRHGRTIYRHSGGNCLLCHTEPEENMISASRSAPLFSHRVISESTAYQTTHMLRGVMTHGTGRSAGKTGHHLAGKTGTTNNFRDAWFIGFSPSLVTGVWVGIDDFSTLGRRESGARAALPIWIDFMKKALKNRPNSDFYVPPDVYFTAIDPETGLQPGQEVQRIVLEAFKKDQSPEKEQEASSETTLFKTLY